MELGGQGSFQQAKQQGPPGLPCTVTPQGHGRHAFHQITAPACLSLALVSAFSRNRAVTSCRSPGRCPAPLPKVERNAC
jgi:hypothetical protein